MGIDGSVDGEKDHKLVLQELQTYSKTNKDVILKLPRALHALCIDELIEQLFFEFDCDKSGFIEGDEWEKIHFALASLHLDYMLVLSFQTFRAFYGRGQTWRPNFDGHDDIDTLKYDLKRASTCGSYRRTDNNLVRQTWRPNSCDNDDTEWYEYDDREEAVLSGGCQYHERNLVRDLDSFRDLDRCDEEHPLCKEQSACHDTDRLHYGDSERERCEEHNVCENLRTFRIGWDRDLHRKSWNPIPPGWLEDLWFYSANNHPLHSIFSCDTMNPCNYLDRLAMELGTVGLTLFTLGKHELWVVEGKAPHWLLAEPQVFNLTMVTVPGLIIWWVLFLSFSCPVIGYVDESSATTAECQRAEVVRTSTTIFGYAFVVLGLSALVIPQIGCSFTEHWYVLVSGRLKGYVISTLLMVFVYFNPLIAWGQPNPGESSNIGDLIGLGQWTIEKQKFQAICKAALRKLKDVP